MNIRKLAVISFVLLLGMVSTAYAQQATKVVRLSVSGMTSAACPVLLKSAVKKIEGVKHVDASLETHSATIEFDENLTSLHDIQEVISDQVGFSTDLK